MATQTCQVCETSSEFTVVTYEITIQHSASEGSSDYPTSKKEIQDFRICDRCLRRARKSNGIFTLLIISFILAFLFGFLYWDNGGQTLIQLLSKKETGSAGPIIQFAKNITIPLLLVTYHYWFIAVPVILLLAFVYGSSKRGAYSDLLLKILYKNNVVWQEFTFKSEKRIESQD